MSERRHHSTGTEFEARIGYDRAVRVGDVVHVSGTLGIGPDGCPPQGAYAQSVASLERIKGALEAVGASLADVVRTRMYVVDVELPEPWSSAQSGPDILTVTELREA